MHEIIVVRFIREVSICSDGLWRVEIIHTVKRLPNAWHRHCSRTIINWYENTTCQIYESGTKLFLSNRCFQFWMLQIVLYWRRKKMIRLASTPYSDAYFITNSGAPPQPHFRYVQTKFWLPTLYCVKKLFHSFMQNSVF